MFVGLHDIELYGILWRIYMLGLIGKKMFPSRKDVYVRIPRTCEDVHRHRVIKFADDFKVATQLTLKHKLSWLFRPSMYSLGAFKCGGGKPKSQRPGEALWERLNRPLPALKVGRATAMDVAALGAGKGEKLSSLLELPEGMQPCNTLIIARGDPFQNPDPRAIR